METSKAFQTSELCFLVNINFKYRTELNADLDELKALVLSASCVINDSISFSRQDPDSKYFCGEGKLQEIKDLIAENNSKLVIFNHAISPTQERNIEKFLDCKIIDRTRLILEIFAQRAKTYEGKLQIELAQLSHQSTRLVKSWTHLERQKGGIGVRSGPGETQIELDRRMIRQRIIQIKQKLDKVKKQRNLSRLSRKKNRIPSVAFVGYTNAGKSTLFNSLSGANVEVKDQLFATLDPTIRFIKVPKLGKVAISDTVGFIRNLPHNLVEAFKATFEETVDADILIHVIDYSDENHISHADQVNLVLKEIGAQNKPIIKIYNKIDAIDNNAEPKIIFDEDKPTEVYLSAKTTVGIDLLYQSLAHFFNSDWVKGVLNLPSSYAKIRAQLYDLGVIEKESILENGDYALYVYLAKSDLELISDNNKIDLNNYLVKVET